MKYKERVKNWIHLSNSEIEYHGIVEIFTWDMPAVKQIKEAWRVAVVFLHYEKDIDILDRNYPSRYLFLLRDRDALTGLTNWIKDEGCSLGVPLLLCKPTELFQYQGVNPSGHPFLECKEVLED